MRSAGRQVAERQLSVLRHQGARQLPLKNARRLCRLRCTPLQQPMHSFIAVARKGRH